MRSTKNEKEMSTASHAKKKTNEITMNALMSTGFAAGAGLTTITSFLTTDASRKAFTMGASHISLFFLPVMSALLIVSASLQTALAVKQGKVDATKIFQLISAWTSALSLTSAMAVNFVPGLAASSPMLIPALVLVSLGSMLLQNLTALVQNTQKLVNLDKDQDAKLGANSNSNDMNTKKALGLTIASKAGNILSGAAGIASLAILLGAIATKSSPNPIVMGVMAGLVALGVIVKAVSLIARTATKQPNKGNSPSLFNKEHGTLEDQTIAPGLGK